MSMSEFGKYDTAHNTEHFKYTWPIAHV